MQPADFPQANARFGPPPGLAESQVRTVPAHLAQVVSGSVDGARQIITAWKPTAEELQKLQNGALIYLSCLGGLPPHFLTTSFEEALRPA
jgi:hypothetical protein